MAKKIKTAPEAAPEFDLLAGATETEPTTITMPEGTEVQVEYQVPATPDLCQHVAGVKAWFERKRQEQAARLAAKPAKKQKVSK